MGILEHKLKYIMREKLMERLWIVTKRLNKIDSLFLIHKDNTSNRMRLVKLFFTTKGEILCLERVLKLLSSN